MTEEEKEFERWADGHTFSGDHLEDSKEAYIAAKRRDRERIEELEAELARTKNQAKLASEEIGMLEAELADTKFRAEFWLKEYYTLEVQAEKWSDENDSLKAEIARLREILSHVRDTDLKIAEHEAEVNKPLVEREDGAEESILKEDNYEGMEDYRDLCAICGIGFYLPSGRCDHCNHKRA